MSPASNERFAGAASGSVFARGDLRTVVAEAWKRRSDQPIILEDATGRTLDFDLASPLEVVLSRLTPDAPPPGRGRPKLGVVAREITLLPRHWDWLSSQPGGASAALRRLVDGARRENVADDVRRQTKEAAYRIATTLAGDRPGYEEAIRALFANDLDAFGGLVDVWPADIAAYLRDLTASLAEPS
jgi:hypothetical protein